MHIFIVFIYCIALYVFYCIVVNVLYSMTFYCIVLQRVVLHAQTMAKSGVMLCTGAGLCY